MDWVTEVVGRRMPMSAVVTGFTLFSWSLICTKPNRNSFTRFGENRCVSVTLKKRARAGVSKGKFSDVELMLLGTVLHSDSCRSPPPNGRKLSESEKKKRAEILSWPPRNSRSQFEVNWSSENLPGSLNRKAPVFTTPFVNPGVQPRVHPAATWPDGIRNPLFNPNCPVVSSRCKSPVPPALERMGSMLGSPKALFRLAGERSAGKRGMFELMNVPGESPLRCRVPW